MPIGVGVRNARSRNGWAEPSSAATKPIGYLGQRFALLALAVVHATTCNVSRAQSAYPDQDTGRQSRSDVWWTGPMLANSAETLPRGHVLFEPYFYVVHGRDSNSFSSSAYILYGVLDKLTVGFIPIVGFNTATGVPSSSTIGIGDVALVAQYGVTTFHEDSWMPSTSLYLQQSIPSGRYDQLGDRPTNGFGSGSFTTRVALNVEEYFWLPNGRIVRMRLNLAGLFSSAAHVEDVSVYGTAEGFRGEANPGNSFFVIAAWEYSLTRRWVLALDFTYTYSASTRAVGFSTETGRTQRSQPVLVNSGASDAFGFAPAVEYSFSSRLGILLGVRLIPFGHHTPPTITPAVAFNIVY